MKLCKRCGQEFSPKSSRQTYCNAPISVPCIICGKPMIQKCSTRPQTETCSKACQTKEIVTTSHLAKIREKIIVINGEDM